MMSSAYGKQVAGNAANFGQPPVHPMTNAKHQGKASRFAKNPSEIYSRGTPTSSTKTN